MPQNPESEQPSAQSTRLVPPNDEWLEWLFDEVQDAEQDILSMVERHGTIVPDIPEFIDYESVIPPAPEYDKRPFKLSIWADQAKRLRKLKDKEPDHGKQNFTSNLAQLDHDELLIRVNKVASTLSSFCAERNWPRKRFAVFATKAAFAEIYWLMRRSKPASWMAEFDNALAIVAGGLKPNTRVTRRVKPIFIVGYWPRTAVLALERANPIDPQDWQINLGIL